jgi:small subunit ribosomal protein S21
VQVFVRDNDVNGALRVLKKKMQREGVFREMRRRRSYEKPSERRVHERAEAVRRYRKAMRKRLDREGYWAGRLAQHLRQAGEDAYRLTMAVAGFSPSKFDATVHENTLVVTGKAQKEEEKKSGDGYLHRGIVRRAFDASSTADSE